MSKLMDLCNLLKDDVGNLQLVFIRKTAKNYAGFRPNINEELKALLFNNLKEYLLGKALLDYSEIPFNPCKNIAETFTYCKNDYVGLNNYNELINAIESAQEDTNPDTEEYLSFYVLTYTLNSGKKLYFMRTLIKYKNLQKRGFLCFKIGNTYQKLSEAALGVDSAIDLVCTNKEILVLNYSSLEKIFRLNDEFEKKANEVLDIVSKSDFIKNFDSFRDACNTNKTNRMLTKIAEDKKLLNTVLANKNKVKALINSRNLDIAIDDEKLIYEKKEQLSDVINVLRDAFYTTDITNREGVDE